MTTLAELQATGCQCGHPRCSMVKEPSHGGFDASYHDGVFYFTCRECDDESETIELTIVERLRMDAFVRDRRATNDLCGTHCGESRKLVPKCHPSAGVRMVYWKDPQELDIECVECGSPVFMIRHEPSPVVAH